MENEGYTGNEGYTESKVYMENVVNMEKESYMEKEVHTEVDAHSEQYIDRLSAAILTLAKMIEGTVSGYTVFKIVAFFLPLFGLLSAGANDFRQFLITVAKENEFYSETVEQCLDILMGSLSFSTIIWILLMALILLLLLLPLLEAIALLMVRFMRKGAEIVETVHQVQMILTVGYLLGLVYLVVSYYKNAPKLTENISGSLAVQGIGLLFAIGAVVILLFLILKFFYHRDIVKAMHTVSKELRTGNKAELKETHLSGISFFLALPYAFLAAGMLLGVIRGEHRFSNENIHIIYETGMYLILAIKHFAVAVCYGNIKKYR